MYYIESFSAAFPKGISAGGRNRVVLYIYIYTQYYIKRANEWCVCVCVDGEEEKNDSARRHDNIILLYNRLRRDEDDDPRRELYENFSIPNT